MKEFYEMQKIDEEIALLMPEFSNITRKFSHYIELSYYEQFYIKIKCGNAARENANTIFLCRTTREGYNIDRYDFEYYLGTSLFELTNKLQELGVKPPKTEYLG